MREKIVTVCYGMKQFWDSRKEAMDRFLKAMMNSEGSERERYTNIYCQLAEGKNYCTDVEENRCRNGSQR